MFLRWLGHASFELDMAGRTALFDPWLDPAPKGVARLVPPAVTEDKIRACDAIFVSHEHFDHCDPHDIAAIVSRTWASVVAPPETLSTLDIPQRSKVSALPGDVFTLKGIDVEVTQARHPESANPVGFVVRSGGKSIYFAGDTYDFYEMTNIDVNVAILPISGRGGMDSISAIKAIKELSADYVVPMTYGTYPSLPRDAKDFETRAMNANRAKPVVLQPGEGFDF